MKPGDLSPLNNDTPTWAPRLTSEPLDDLPALGWRLVLCLLGLLAWAAVLFAIWWT